MLLETIEAFVSAYKGAGVPLEEIPEALRQERHRALLQRIEALRQQEPYWELRIEVVAQQAGTWGDAEPSVRLRLIGDLPTIEAYLSELSLEFEQEAYDLFRASPRGRSQMRTVRFNQPVPLRMIREVREVGKQPIRFLSAALTPEGRVQAVTVASRGLRQPSAFLNFVRRLHRRGLQFEVEATRGYYRLTRGRKVFRQRVARVRGEEYARQKQP